MQRVIFILKIIDFLHIIVDLEHDCANAKYCLSSISLSEFLLNIGSLEFYCGRL